MLHAIPLDGPVDLASLDAFLASDRAPPKCMRLAELDGFLAGIVVSPEMIMPSEWLPEIWQGDEPDFADLGEMQSILGIVLRRYNEIARQLDAGPGAYRPLIATDKPEGTDASDWALGFLHALALRQASWLPLLRDRMGSVLLSPIMLIASSTERANLPLDPGEGLPPAEMQKLLAGADQMLGVCLTGMRMFFRTRGTKPARKRTVREGVGKRKAKRR
jgi:uncharacterized protein